jgi:hypothetical protein
MTSVQKRVFEVLIAVAVKYYSLLECDNVGSRISKRYITVIAKAEEEYTHYISEDSDIVYYLF